MKDPIYPDDHCVKVLRSTFAQTIAERPSPQQLGDLIVASLHAIARAGAEQDWQLVAAEAGTIATMALVLQMDALCRMPPKAKA